MPTLLIVTCLRFALRKSITNVILEKVKKAGDNGAGHNTTDSHGKKTTTFERHLSENLLLFSFISGSWLGLGTKNTWMSLNINRYMVRGSDHIV